MSRSLGGTLGGFAELIEAQIAKYGYKKVLSWPLGLLSIASALGLAFKGPGVASIGLLAMLLYLLTIVVVLLHNRRALKASNHELQSMLKQHAVKLAVSQSSNPDLFIIRNWHEVLEIGKNGDTVIVRDFKLEVGSVSLDSFTTACIANEAVSGSEKDDVQVEAQTLNADGSLGVSRLVHKHWESDERLRVVVYFEHELNPQDIFAVRITLTWPRYSKALLDGRREPNYWTLTRQCDKLSTTIVFKAALGMGNRILLTSFAGSSSARSSLATNGDTVIEYEESPAPRNRKFGFEVDTRRAT